MTREGAAGAPTGLHSRFSHTALAVYITFSFALCCIGYDSTHVSVLQAARGPGPNPGGPPPLPPGWPLLCPPACCCFIVALYDLMCLQDIIQRSHINKKWFYLSGAPAHEWRSHVGLPCGGARCVFSQHWLPCDCPPFSWQQAARPPALESTSHQIRPCLPDRRCHLPVCLLVSAPADPSRAWLRIPRLHQLLGRLHLLAAHGGVLPPALPGVDGCGAAGRPQLLQRGWGPQPGGA